MFERLLSMYWDEILSASHAPVVTVPSVVIVGRSFFVSFPLFPRMMRSPWLFPIIVPFSVFAESDVSECWEVSAEKVEPTG